MRQEAVELLRRGRQTHPFIITEKHLLGLPEAVQLYLRSVGVAGKEAIRTVRLKQRGSLRLKEGQKWLSLTAEQYFTASPPGFVWSARVKSFPYLNISVTDMFVNGHGKLRARLASVIPVANATGPEVDQGELLRYLAEIIWFPTAWLSDNIQWKSIDRRSAEVSLQQAGLKVTAVIHLNDNGHLDQISSERYREEQGRFILRPWRGLLGDYREVDGMLIPMKVEVSWHLESDDFTCFRAQITEIEYNI